jgi:RNA polymerase sigma-70 factor (ECF subfamily)
MLTPPRAPPPRVLTRRWGEDAMDAVDDAYLVRRARDGYLDAYELLVARHAARAYRVALRILGNHHDAEDVAQEALVAAWRALPNFRADATFSTWLYRIVTTRSLNRINRTMNTYPLDVRAELATRSIGPPEQAERSAAADAVAAAIATLPGAQRVALVLYQFEGLSYADIADVTGTSVAAVRSHLHRARRTLASTLRDWR